MSPDHLRQTLQTLLQADVSTSPAFDHLMLDYSNYHGMFLLLGIPITLLLSVVALMSWRKVIHLWGQEARRTKRQLTAFLGVLSTSLTLFLGLVLLGNASNVLNPRHGFSSLVATLSPATPGSELAGLRHSFDVWMSSGSVALPETVRQHIQERLAWQQPKAVICGVLLVVLMALTVNFWTRNGQAEVTVISPGNQVFLVLAVLALALLVLMFIANTQAAFAPITITMLYG